MRRKKQAMTGVVGNQYIRLPEPPLGFQQFENCIIEAPHKCFDPVFLVQYDFIEGPLHHLAAKHRIHRNLECLLKVRKVPLKRNIVSPRQENT